VATLLVDHIRRNGLLAGAAMPSEIQTSADLQVSRGVVREAYRSLSSAGLVDIANGRAPRVGLISNRALLRVIQHALWTHQASATQILQLRQAIDERAAELASVHRTPAQLKTLRQSVAAMRAAGLKTDSYVKADVRFHEVLGAATGNPLFGLVGSALRAAMGASMRASLAGRRSRAELGRVIDTHSTLVDAIERRAPREARRLMRRHYAEALAAVERLTAARTPAVAGRSR
jgi:GntR family transcriptional repressor for pyruvate dehydrogenase complex